MGRPQETEQRFTSLPVPDAYADLTAGGDCPRDTVCLVVTPVDSATPTEITVRMVQAPSTNITIRVLGTSQTVWGRFSTVTAVADVAQVLAGYHC